MARNQLELFCTYRDIFGLLNEVQERLSVSFAVCGLFDRIDLHTLATPGEVSELIAKSDSAELTFLVVGFGDSIVMQQVPQRNGSIRYAVDQLCNPRSVVFRPGRLIDDRILVAGQIGTVSSDPFSLRLFGVFVGAIRKQFVKVKSYWVGAEASAILDSGGRLIATLKAPPEYDLRR